MNLRIMLIKKIAWNQFWEMWSAVCGEAGKDFAIAVLQI